MAPISLFAVSGDAGYGVYDWQEGELRPREKGGLFTWPLSAKMWSRVGRTVLTFAVRTQAANLITPPRKLEW